MKKGKKLEPLFLLPNRPKPLQIFMAVMLLYFLFTTFRIETSLAFRTGFVSVSSLLVSEHQQHNHLRKASNFPSKEAFGVFQGSLHRKTMQELQKVSTLSFIEVLNDTTTVANNEFSELHKEARHAWIKGKKVWEEVKTDNMTTFKVENFSDSCQHSISLSGSELREKKGVMVLPCGLTLGSHVTVVGTPRWAHWENDPKISVVKEKEEKVMVSQFMMELQGLKIVDKEEPPRILHFNPRLKGDYSGKPVIEQNTCYRMQWGSALRCEGWKSRADEDTVDGQVKCEKWIRDDSRRSKESKATWWLNRLIGRTKVTIDWPYPFVEGRLFVLTVSAGLEGYHVSVDGRHVTSFPYRTGFSLEDATGLSIKGDVDVHSIFAASLPTSHPSFAPQMHLELLPQWKAPPVLHVNVELFIGILSAGNHFAERMAVRKSWMQHKLIKSSNVVARFFVALHGRKDINVEIKKEADYFGDIIIVPYMDHYDLVVLKTIAITEYGIHAVAAKYIMKCDDDTYVRVDSIISEARKVGNGRSLYIGNMNYHHRPLRHGKWAVTYEEWSEEEYPTYANGPGYIVSSDIAQFIVSNFKEHRLKLFKMEDVSMGMWVEQFNSSRPVEYVHSLKFCQFGCIEDYYTAHYQSPRQMTCMWHKLQHQRKPLCCNMR
ncbi:hypothetical protein VNO77_04201 [Canavalia gladiata]|uniref:Galectin domain-containing protein n=1 Tax=Canavalia gladiata TaxID=3824 RepID=A0AAN9MWY7_CANGL